MTGPKPFGGKSPALLKGTLMPFMDRYLEHMEEVCGSNSYPEQIKRGLKHFSIYAEQENLRYPDEIERRHLLRYQLYLQTAKSWKGIPLAESYQQQLTKYLRGWLHWLVEVGYLDSTPWVDIPTITRRRDRPRTLNGEEVERLFETHKRQAFTISPFYYHRREVILVLMYGWGLRLGELANLTVTSLDMRLQWVTVPIGDGGRSKTLPYSDELKSVVQRWLVARGSKARRGEDALLIDKEGKRLSDQMIKKIVAELGQRAGVKTTPNMLRGAFAEALIAKDVDLDQVMKMMGHTSREATRMYVPKGDPEVQEAHQSAMGPMLNDLLRGGSR